MPNHVDLIFCPENEDGLALALGAPHRRWANFVKARGRWRGHLFDGRFASVAMDEAHLNGGGAICRNEPCPSALGRTGGRLALVECRR